MSEHSFEMMGEGARILLPEGWNTFFIVDMELITSKAGNECFKVTLEEPKTGATEEVYCITQKGKRWLLKSLLTGVGIMGDEKGIYTFDTQDVIHQDIDAKIVHEDNVYINRDGDEVKEKRNKIQSFRKAQIKATV